MQHPAGDGIRVDTSLADGLDVSTDYDPMLAKVIAWGDDRDEARRRLVGALEQTAVFGFETNVEFLRLLLTQDDVVAGRLDTGLIARVLDTLPYADPSARTVAEAALVRDAHERDGRPDGRWHRGDGWRLGPAAARVHELEITGTTTTVRIWADRVQVGDDDPLPAAVSVRGDTAT